MSYYGESACSSTYASGKNKGKSCLNKAYYYENDQYLCGVHSNKDKRTKLEKNPNSDKIKEDKLVQDLSDVEEAKLDNIKNGIKGDVIVSKLAMMKNPETIKGYYKVFPNFKHGGRKDGFGCPALSPKSLGPIEHIMPNLPICKNLENFHQFSKVFSFELDENGQLLDGILQMRIDAYNNPIPFRHKYDLALLATRTSSVVSLNHGTKFHGLIPANKNIPLYSLYYDSKGIPHKFSYFGSRYFYCRLYERLIMKLEEFIYLRSLIDSGYNLQIVGYDGYSVDKSLFEHYCDTSKPFGHELVLYTLLVIENPDQYPWNIVLTIIKKLMKVSLYKFNILTIILK